MSLTQTNHGRVLLLLQTHQLSKYGGRCEGCGISLDGKAITIEGHQATLLQAAGLIKPDAPGTMGGKPTHA